MGYKVPGSDLKQGVNAITSGDFPAGAAPQVLSGASLLMAKIQPGTLSAHVTTDPETNTLAVFAKWQVSVDASTWYDVVGAPNSPANVAIATGTSGSDATVNAVVPAPDAVYAWPYARIQLYTGTGVATTGDSGGAKYYYRENGLVR